MEQSIAGYTPYYTQKEKQFILENKEWESKIIMRR